MFQPPFADRNARRCVPQGLAFDQLAADFNAIQRAIQSTPDNAKRVQATIGAYFDFIEAEGEAFRLLFESDMSVEPAVRERLNRMTYDCAAAVSAVISLDTGLPQEAAMLLGVGLIGSAQVTARHWLERDSKLSREQAQTLATNIIWRGISGFPRELETKVK